MRCDPAQILLDARSQCIGNHLAAHGIINLRSCLVSHIKDIDNLIQFRGDPSRVDGKIQIKDCTRNDMQKTLAIFGEDINNGVPIGGLEVDLHHGGLSQRHALAAGAKAWPG